ncbi:MAG TPA: deoxyribose-phosphate aldolase [Edaphocola sp.]|nr:deoxyribose-phosphate aldolase [Edaphocola sp.]
MDLGKYIDHTLLKSTASIIEIEQLCKEAIQNKFKAVCVPPYYVKAAKKFLKNKDVLVATVIGFPMGYSCTESKIAEINTAIQDGADELDWVQNIAAVKNGDWEFIEKEIEICLKVIRKAEKTIKVIIESGVLTEEHIIKSCEIYSKNKVDYIKTSTGYAEQGANLRHVELIKNQIPDYIKIKASGGIRTYEDALNYINKGVSRIGTSSGINIIIQSKLN